MFVVDVRATIDRNELARNVSPTENRWSGGIFSDFLSRKTAKSRNELGASVPIRFISRAIEKSIVLRPPHNRVVEIVTLCVGPQKFLAIFTEIPCRRDRRCAAPIFKKLILD